MASSMLAAEAAAATESTMEPNIDEALDAALRACANDPNFAVICAFLQKFGNDLGLDVPSFKHLQEWLTRTDEVPPPLRDMQIKLLRKTRKTVHEKSWETALSKFCFSYSAQDAWELERFGYKNAGIKRKLRILRELLESQFERNTKFKAKILTQSADSLRSKPIGRDRLGHAYWVTQDRDCNLRIYQEHLDEDTWQVVATNRDEFVNLISRLRGNEVVLPSSKIGVVDEDTSSSSDSSPVTSQKPPPPEEQDDSQEDEQKVPKLSIKLLNEKSLKEGGEFNDMGKGEEDLAAEEDENRNKNSNKCAESCEDEFEEIEEECEEENESNVEDEKEECEIEGHRRIAKTVKPLVISQNKIKSVITEATDAEGSRKRALEDNNPKSNECEQKKARPSLLDYKKLGKSSKFEEDNYGGEENHEHSNDDDEESEEDDVEEEDIDSAAAEEDENEEKQIEDFDDDEDSNSNTNEVGEEITDPVFRIHGEGSGKECELGNFWGNMETYFEDEEGSESVGEVFEDIAFCVRGEGTGKECCVGNINPEITNDEEPISSTKVKMKEEETCELISEQHDNGKNQFQTEGENSAESNEREDESIQEESIKSNSDIEKKNKENLSISNMCTKNEKDDNINGDKVPISSESSISDVQIQPEQEGCTQINSPECQQDLQNDDTTKEVPHVNSVKEVQFITKSKSDDVPQKVENKPAASETIKKELEDSKQNCLDRKIDLPEVENKLSAKSTSSTWNRKRRLEGFVCQQTITGRNQNSESEVDINSENTEDLCIDHTAVEGDEHDVGGKRLKMRPKQTNTELRKKIEAQKAAVNDETTSSSGGEEESLCKRKTSPKTLIAVHLSSENLDKPNGENKNEDVTNNDENDKVAALIRPASNESTLPSSSLVDVTTDKLSSENQVEQKIQISSNVLECESKQKSPFSPSKKFPITKPLKKNLLTQIRQEESEEEAIPRKRTTSADFSSATSFDNKKSITLDINTLPKITIDVNTTTTPDRQRKRRSSEELIQSKVPEQPEIKKEVVEEDSLISEKCLQNEKKFIIEKTDEDKELKTEILTTDSSRRSGRRGVSTVITAEIPQAKRTKDCNKNSTKKQISNTPIHTSDEEDDDDDDDDNKSDIIQPLTLKIKDEKEIGNCKQFATDDNKSIKQESMCSQADNKETKKTIKATRKKREVDALNIIEVNDNETPVRQSRRIAQQKIREEAERRKLEEIALRTMKQELKKKKMAEKQSDPTVMPPSESSSEEEEEESDAETKKKTQKKKLPGKNGSWSSGSEEQEEPDDEEEEYHHRYETDHGSPLFKSDHEFSPESDIEDESQAVPMKRARTARKEDAAENDEVEEEEACQKCNKSDHPEWILLCDNCDKGYHCSCLSPVLFYIPEGNWYCPPCQQVQLIAALEDQLKELDELVKRKKIEAEEEKRLADEEKHRKEEEDKMLRDSRMSKKSSQRKVSRDDDNSNLSVKSDGTSEDGTEASSDKISNTKGSNNNRSRKQDKRNRRDRRQKLTRGSRSRLHQRNTDHDSDSRKTYRSNSTAADSNSTSSSTYSDSDNEPIYKLRKRRQINVSYRLNEYDDLINSALKKEMDEAAGAGNLGRGKDISTIIEADKEEKARQKKVTDKGDTQLDESNHSEVKENNTDECKSPGKATTDNSNENDKKSNKADSEDEVLGRKPHHHKHSLKKKQRKLTTLDISSEDDHGSDEDFKGSSLDDDEEEDTSVSVSSNSDSSLEVYRRKGKSKKKQRKAARRAFRERRKERRFIVDETDEDEDAERPKSKKKRKVESDYTESEVDDEDVSELSENVDSADLCDDTSTDESDGAWRPNKRKKSKKTTAPAVTKNITPKHQPEKKNKKIEYSDDDVTESEEDNDDEEDDEPLGVGGGKQPRSQPLKTTPKAAKAKTKTKTGASSKTKKKKSSDDAQSFSDSGDSTRRTRGRRYAYIEDFEDDSSDGGIKPGVQRPDTPPEERERFIKRQEEIKRMLAEKNAEGAKLAATPRLTPIKNEGEKDKRSPSKSSGDSLSTVPLSVIRQAKVLDIDYLQRRGENLDDLSNDVDDVGDDFDDVDLPDGLPDDMDEDAIARMVEEEEEFGAVAARDLPNPDEVLRTASLLTKPKLKETEKAMGPVQTVPTLAPTQQTSSLLQEPVRKRLPMPTIHPPLLRHQLFANEQVNISEQQIIQRNPALSSSHLLQNALSAPLGLPQQRAYSALAHSMLNRLPQNVAPPIILSASVEMSKAPPVPTAKTMPLGDQELADKNTTANREPEAKPRGRRKKITPLRDTLQKQQTAAAVAAAASATAANTVAKIRDMMASSPASVIKPATSNKCQPQGSVITSFPHTSQYFPGSAAARAMTPTGGYPGAEGFYRHTSVRLPPPPNTQRHRGPPQLPAGLLTSHPAMRTTYGPPPPLKGSINATSAAGNPSNVRPPSSHMAQYVGGAPTSRHSGAHLNIYGPSIYSNSNFAPRGNHRPPPPPIHPSQYPSGSRAYPPYGFYPPPPPLTTPPPQTTQRPPLQQATSVIVSNTSSTSSKLSSSPASSSVSSVNDSSDMIKKSISVKAEITEPNHPTKSLASTDSNKVCADSRKKLTTLETFSTSGDSVTPLSIPVNCNVSREKPSPGLQANLADDSSPPPPTAISENPAGAHEQATEGGEGHSSEFSGLVSYFSSQHDDYNT